MSRPVPTPKHVPFAISYAFAGKPHDYLPDVVGILTNGKLFIAEAGMEDDKRGIATSPKPRPHDGSHACSNKAPSGLAPSAL